MPRSSGTLATGFCSWSSHGEFQNVYLPGDAIHRGHRLSKSPHHAAEDRQQSVCQRFPWLWIGRVWLGCSFQYAKPCKETRHRKCQRFVLELREYYTHRANPEHIQSRPSPILRCHCGRTLDLSWTSWTTGYPHEFRPLSCASPSSSYRTIVVRATVISTYNLSRIFANDSRKLWIIVIVDRRKFFIRLGFAAKLLDDGVYLWNEK